MRGAKGTRNAAAMGLFDFYMGGIYVASDFRETSQHFVVAVKIGVPIKGVCGCTLTACLVLTRDVELPGSSLVDKMQPIQKG